MTILFIPPIPKHLEGKPYLKLGMLIKRISKRDGSSMVDAESFYTKGDGSEAEKDTEFYLSHLNHDKFEFIPVEYLQWSKP